MAAAPIPLPVSFGTTSAAATPTRTWAAVFVVFVGLMVSTSLLAKAVGPGCHPQVLEKLLDGVSMSVSPVEPACDAVGLGRLRVISIPWS